MMYVLNSSPGHQIASRAEQHSGAVAHQRAGDLRRIEVVTDPDPQDPVLHREYRPAVSGAAVYHERNRPLFRESADKVARTIDHDSYILKSWLAIIPVNRSKNDRAPELLC